MHGDFAGVVYLTEQEIAAEMETVARELGLSVTGAFQRLDAGELDGTSAELRLRMLRYLRNPDAEIRPRAAAYPLPGASTVCRGT